jgi:hypothetical protein
MMRYISIFALAALSGCASIASGTSQNITIVSTPTGADCAISRQGVVIQQITTPAYPTIGKSVYDLTVACSKFGFATSTQVNQSGVEGWVFGNIILGGIGGLITDRTTGAQNSYDSVMNFKLPANSPTMRLVAGPDIIVNRGRFITPPQSSYQSLSPLPSRDLSVAPNPGVPALDPQMDVIPVF